MKLLQRFYSDFQTRDEVKAYLLAELREMAASKALAGEDTSGFKEAKECIDKCFLKLERSFSVKERKTPTSHK